jgi:DNA-binding MltR family transcriptional regulator
MEAAYGPQRVPAALPNRASFALYCREFRRCARCSPLPLSISLEPNMKQPKPGPKAVPATKPNLAKLIEIVGRHTHASNALAVVSIIDYDLERCILCKFRKLNSETRNRLFRGYGPLSRLSARIDIAYALDITSDRVHRELGKIREIRNLFAHTKALLNFDEAPVRPLFENLDIDPNDIDPDEKDTRLNRFMAHAMAMDRYLEGFLVRMGVTEEIYGLKPSIFDY